MTLRGCYVQAPGGAPREFILPILTDDEEEQLARKKGMLACESGRWKYSGTESLLWKKINSCVRTQTTTPTKPFRFLDCKVVPEQPLLRIRRTSVTHGAVMLYDGETYSVYCCSTECRVLTRSLRSFIRITLENVSNLPIDFLRVVFDDSTVAPAQQALAEGDLSVFDTYETEHSLIHRPLFSWDQKEAKNIPPGQKLTVTFKCFGKVGW